MGDGAGWGGSAWGGSNAGATVDLSGVYAKLAENQAAVLKRLSELENSQSKMASKSDNMFLVVVSILTLFTAIFIAVKAGSRKPTPRKAKTDRSGGGGGGGGARRGVSPRSAVRGGAPAPPRGARVPSLRTLEVA